MSVATVKVLVVDDVHWADATTMQWLTWVHGRAGELLVVATARPGTSIAGAVPLALGPLDAVDVGALIGANTTAGRTGDIVARNLLASWEKGARERFVKVMPRDYRRALEQAEELEAEVAAA